MYDREYAFTKKLENITVNDAITRVKEVLSTQGFGVLTEIDVKATLKNRLGIDRKPYVILGACNPALAHRALETEPPIGLFLPCNVDVFEGDDGAVYVQTPRPVHLFGLVGNPGLGPIAVDVEQRLAQALEML